MFRGAQMIARRRHAHDRKALLIRRAGIKPSRRSVSATFTRGGGRQFVAPSHDSSRCDSFPHKVVKYGLFRSPCRTDGRRATRRLIGPVRAAQFACDPDRSPNLQPPVPDLDRLRLSCVPVRLDRRVASVLLSRKDKQPNARSCGCVRPKEPWLRRHDARLRPGPVLPASIRAPDRSGWRSGRSRLLSRSAAGRKRSCRRWPG